MVEIKVMLLSEIWNKEEAFTKYKDWIYQEKHNGCRGILHIKDHKIVGIRNRSNNPIFYCFPEFKDVTFPYNEAILDCEIVVFKNGKSIFYNGIDKRRSVPTTKTMQEYPATIVVFDALKINDEVLLMKPYKYRYEKLSGIILSDKLKVAENYDGRVLWDKIVKEDREGVVIKNPGAVYELDKRSLQNLKLKNYKMINISVAKIEQNEKGTKVFSTVNVNGTEIMVEAQLAGCFDVAIGSEVTIKYLDIVGNRMIQPCKVTREQAEA
jgi:ATP-dependent DNA ligase